MKIKIVQPAGLGDILFCLKIAKELIKEGNELFWPVIPYYYWIVDYIKIGNLHWNDIEKPDKTIDLQSAGGVFPEIPIMDAKYKMVGMNYDKWQSFVKYERNCEREEGLFREVVKEQPYCLICEIFASPPHPLRRYVEGSREYHNVYLEWIEKYTPFDWCKVIEGASELRIVDTCYTHIIETLDLKAKSMKLYSRDGKFYTDHLWSKKWEYVI